MRELLLRRFFELVSIVGRSPICLGDCLVEVLAENLTVLGGVFMRTTLLLCNNGKLAQTIACAQ